jgi:hypothetical protein
MRFDAIDPGPALTRAELDAYCEEHGLALPASLERQLLDQNGGAPSADTSVPLTDGAETDLFCLFGLTMRHEASELALVAETYAGRVPAGLVPFANDSGGNLFLVGGDDLVWFWDHEREGSPEAALPMNVSLDRFLGVLTR